MVLAAVAALAVGAAIQSATGFGLALVAAPVLLATLEPAEAVTTVCLVAVIVNVLMLFAERRPRAVRGGDVSVVLVAAAPGLAVGVLVLDAVGREGLQVGVGAAVIAATLVQARLPAVVEHRGEPSRGAGAVAGSLAGVLTTSTGVNGPPLVLWLVRHAGSAAEVRDSLAVIFIALNVSGITVIALALGGARLADPGLLALGAAAGAAGWLTGRLGFERMSGLAFRRAALAVSLGAGVASVTAGLA